MPLVGLTVVRRLGRVCIVELYPGIDYAAHVLDPDGHAVQLYYAMEQIGWNGQPRPKEQRRTVQPGVWPEALAPLSDTYQGEPFLGPWG